MVASGVDPGWARERARAVLAEARARDCQEAVSVAHRALALAAREFGLLELAADHLHEAVTAARHLPERAAQARLSLVAVRADLGDPVGALCVADLAEGHLTGLDAARLGVQRSVALVRLGRIEEAVACCDLAVQRLTGAGDPRFLAGALLNRGLAHTYLEDYDAASHDLSACVTVARDAGLDHIATLAEANLPFVATRRGDIPAAFTGYQAAEKTLAGYPERLAAMRADFAGALLAAYLPGEARALLGQAVPDLAAAGALVTLAESRLLLAQAELLVGDPYQARASAERAAAELAGQGRHAWVPLAEEVTLRARIAVEEPTRHLLDEVRMLAGRLAAHGWAGPAAALRLTAAELALTIPAQTTEPVPGQAKPASGRAEPIPAEHAEAVPGRAEAGSGWAGGGSPVPATRDAVEADLELVIEGPAATGRAHRVVRHHATALRRSLRGDLPGAFAALRTGLEEATAGHERLEDPGVRAHAVRAGERLADFGLSLALRDGRPEAVLGWAEHWRAVARGHSREPLSIDGLRAALGGTALVEMVRHGDRLAAVVVTADGCVLRVLGSYTAAAEATIRLRYGLRRAGLRDTGTPASGIAGEAAALATRLLDPLAADIGDRPVVIGPTGALHTLPWGTLPAFRGRAICVAASASAWLATAALRPGTRRRAGPLVAAVAGPGLEHAGTEAAMVVRTYQKTTRRTPPHQESAHRTPQTQEAIPQGLPHPESAPLREPDDRAADGPGVVAARIAPETAGVLDALGQAEIVHIAAHGFFSAQSPLLSSITLDDGRLMAYDLLGLGRTPWLVVLSACDAGMAHAPVDGTTLGLAGAFLERGTACVIAGLIPVRDDEALTLMTLVHALLVSGQTPAQALATAAEKTGVQGFACFGSLGHPIPLHDHEPHRP